jgi:hypothetical protein
LSPRLPLESRGPDYRKPEPTPFSANWTLQGGEMLMASPGAPQEIVWAAKRGHSMSQSSRTFFRRSKLVLKRGGEERRHRQIGAGARIDSRRFQLGVKSQQQAFEPRGVLGTRNPAMERRGTDP